MSENWFVDLRARHVPETIGNKAANLRWLIRAGYPVPHTLVCRWEAFQRYQQNHTDLIPQLRSELERKISPLGRYAVRSSASVEDHPGFSFAGQFKSTLDVQGVDAIIQAIWSTWALATSTMVQDYMKKHGLDPSALFMAVIVQEMVTPVVSGVAFSRNPVNARNEIVVEAVPGRGDTLMQAGVTPARWVFGRTGVSVPEATTISQDLIAEVVQQLGKMAKTLRKDIDAEWVFDGQQIYWVQWREITSIKHLKIYSNRISRDMMPGMIKPLVFSVNVPTVTSAWIDLISEVIGEIHLKPEDLVRSFYYRSYFEMGAFRDIFRTLGLPEDSLEMMMGQEDTEKKKMKFAMSLQSLRHLPRLVRFIWRKARLSNEVQKAVPDLEKAFAAFAQDELAVLDEAFLLDRLDQLTKLIRQAAYYNITVPLTLGILTQILRRQLRSSGVDPDQVDLTAGMTELNRFAPASDLLELHRQYEALNPSIQKALMDGENADALDDSGKFFLQAFEAFLQRFGHLSDSGNDFSAVTWREQPRVILDMIAHLQPNAPNPSVTHIPYEKVRIPLFKKKMLDRVVRQYRLYRYLRDWVGFVYTFGYGLLRPTVLALGKRLSARGVLSTPEDVYYLTWDDLRLVVQEKIPPRQALDWVRQRREEMERYQNVVLPMVIYGDDPPPLDIPAVTHLRGMPTSRGIYTGRTVVVRGLQDFSKVQPGSVLVVPFTDIGWTPLFIKAGAVIAESGGLLSHSSIIARELGIPAVVAVEHATRLSDHTLVTVDGYRGTITVHEQ